MSIFLLNITLILFLLNAAFQKVNDDLIATLYTVKDEIFMLRRRIKDRDSDTNSKRAFTFALNSCYGGHVCCSSLVVQLCPQQASLRSFTAGTMQAMHQEK